MEKVIKLTGRMLLLEEVTAANQVTKMASKHVFTTNYGMQSLFNL